MAAAVLHCTAGRLEQRPPRPPSDLLSEAAGSLELNAVSQPRSTRACTVRVCLRRQCARPSLRRGHLALQVVDVPRQGATEMTPHRAVHVLRWRYGKDRATLHCELAFDSHALWYEFRTARDEAGAGARVERFAHVMH